jgi:hypothetical protein
VHERLGLVSRTSTVASIDIGTNSTRVLVPAGWWRQADILDRPQHHHPAGRTGRDGAAGRQAVERRWRAQDYRKVLDEHQVARVPGGNHVASPTPPAATSSSARWRTCRHPARRRRRGEPHVSFLEATGDLDATWGRSSSWTSAAARPSSSPAPTSRA